MYDYRRSARFTSLEPSIDRALDARAAQEGITKQMLVRRYIREGLHPGGGDPPPVAPVTPRKDLSVACMIYLESDVAARLDSAAESSGVLRQEMIRRCIDAGLSGPPKPQAVTRLYELDRLMRARQACLREAEERAKPWHEQADKFEREILDQLFTLKLNCRHERLVVLRSAQAAETAGLAEGLTAVEALCNGCGAYESVFRVAIAALDRGELQIVTEEEFLVARRAFQKFLDDR